MIEAKLAAGGVPQLAETLCAFGNMPDGGTVLLGVDEHRGFLVTGVNDVAHLEAGIAAQARTAVDPPVQVEFDTVETKGKKVLVVEVAGLPAAQKPCRTRGRAYLRQSDGDYVMSDQEVAQLMAMQDRPRFDSAPIPGSTTSDLDSDLVERFLVEARRSSRRLANATAEAILRFKGVTANGNLTTAGLYALGRYPQEFAPSLAVTAAAAPGDGGPRMVDLAHFDGPVPELLDQSVEWVARNTRTAVAYTPDGNARDYPEIPLVAVRELVSNAIVHRDLSPRTQSKRVEIRLLRDKLVIASPGGLWGLTSDQLGTPRGKSAVNEYLYDLGRLVRGPDGRRLIEGEGGGIREAQEALRKAGLAPATFVDTGVSFTAMVHRNPVGARPVAAAGPPRGANVLQALGDESAPITELVERTGLTRRQVKYALDALVRDGRVAVSGGRGDRSTAYRLLHPGF